MLVKKCPKCGTDNDEQRSACSNCFGSLEEIEAVPASQVQRPPQPRYQPRPVQTPLEPRQETQAQQESMRTPPRAGYLPPSAYKPDEVVDARDNAGTGILLAILGVIVLIAVGLIFWEKRPIPEPTVPAEKVVESYINAKKSKQLSKVTPYLSKGSLDIVNSAFSDRQSQSAGFGKGDSANMFIFSEAPSLDELETAAKIAAVRVPDEKAAKERMAIVKLTIEHKPIPQPMQGIQLDLSLPTMEHEFVLVQEKDEWKIDLTLTKARKMSGALELLTGK